MVNVLVESCFESPYYAVYKLKSIPLVCMFDIYKFWPFINLYFPSTPKTKSDGEHRIKRPRPYLRWLVSCVVWCVWCRGRCLRGLKLLQSGRYQIIILTVLEDDPRPVFSVAYSLQCGVWRVSFLPTCTILILPLLPGLSRQCSVSVLCFLMKKRVFCMSSIIDNFRWLITFPLYRMTVCLEQLVARRWTGPLSGWWGRPAGAFGGVY